MCNQDCQNCPCASFAKLKTIMRRIEDATTIAQYMEIARDTKTFNKEQRVIITQYAGYFIAYREFTKEQIQELEIEFKT